MATWTKQTIDRDGVQPTYNAAAGGGDEFVNTGEEYIHAKNDDASSTVITIVSQATSDGLAIEDRAVTIPAGEERLIGPFPTGLYNDNNSKVQLTYSSVTSLTIALLEPGS